MNRQIILVKGLTSLEDEYRVGSHEKTFEQERLFLILGEPKEGKYEFNGAALYDMRLGISLFDSGLRLSSGYGAKFKMMIPNQGNVDNTGYLGYCGHGNATARTRNAIFFEGNIEGVILGQSKPMVLLGIEISPFVSIPQEIRTNKLAIMKEGSEIYKGNQVLEALIKKGFLQYIDFFKKLRERESA